MMRVGTQRRVSLLLRTLGVGALIEGGLGWRVVAIAPMQLSPDLAAAIAEHIQTPVAPRMARTFFLVGLAIFVLQLRRLTNTPEDPQKPKADVA